MTYVRPELQQLDDERFAEDIGVLAPRLVKERAYEVRRQVRSGRWQRAGRCAVTHNGPLTADQLMWVAVLSPRVPVALARGTALCAAGTTGVRAPLTVVHPWGTTPARIAGVTYVRTRHLAAQDLVPNSHPLRCTAARALVDSASRSTPDRARTLVASVVQQRKAEPAEVRAVLDRMSPVRREVLLRLTLADVEGGAHSLPELRFAQLLARSDLPPPTRQVARQRPDGRYYLDAAWEAYTLVAEIDGAHHRDAAQWEADVLRADELLISGDGVLRLLSWWVRDRPELVLDLLRRALMSRGWRPS
ncbi:MAG: DUF559 domain-containing protein [Actinobacteria bacterium]|nr:DUF559 domain-containing protein [Actinomycetota bacterium]MCA1719666.1 DUF559 domain-containing protein [Actinomycetota bacterium]